MPAPNAPTVGVIGLPEVAEALATIGFRVITDSTFRSAATAIAAALREQQFKVVAETLDEVGFVPWVTSTHGKSDGVILLPTNPKVDISGLPGGVRVASLPAAVNDLLPLLGFAAVAHPVGEVSVARAPEPELPTLLVPLSAPEPEPAPAPAPEPEPEPEPEPAPDDVFDVVNTTAVPTPAPSTTAVPTPAPAADPDDVFDVVSAPAPVLAPAPRPVVAPAEVPSRPEPTYTPRAPEAEPHVPRVSEAESHTPRAPEAEPYTQRTPEPEPYVPRVSEAERYTPRVPEPDVDALFGRPEMTGGRGEPGHVVGVYSPKGGLGKTSTALELAQMAGVAGLRAIVVDANRGQGGGVRTSLRLPPDVRTIIDAVNGSPEDAFLTPDAINELRPRALRPIEFGAVLAPPRHLASPDLASGTVYAQVIDWARSQADLVVIDTQEVEGHKTDIFSDAIIPAMRAGAWGVSLVNYDFTTADNLLWAYREFAEAGVTNARQLLIATQWPDFSDADREQLIARYGQSSAFMGVVGIDQNVADQKTLGNILIDSPAVEPVIRALLHRITGRNDFAPREEGKRRRGLFGGVFGGRR